MIFTLLKFTVGIQNTKEIIPFQPRAMNISSLLRHPVVAHKCTNLLRRELLEPGESAFVSISCGEDYLSGHGVFSVAFTCLTVMKKRGLFLRNSMHCCTCQCFCAPGYGFLLFHRMMRCLGVAVGNRLS